MTEYFESAEDDAVTDRLNTHGIVPADYPRTETNWKTGVSPTLLREVAELVEFCYPDTRTVDVGLVEHPGDPDAAPGIVIGDPDDDRYVMLAAKQDCEAGARGGDD